jgi:hypothetical protein
LIFYSNFEKAKQKQKKKKEEKEKEKEKTWAAGPLSRWVVDVERRFRPAPL